MMSYSRGIFKKRVSGRDGRGNRDGAESTRSRRICGYSSVRAIKIRLLRDLASRARASVTSGPTNSSQGCKITVTFLRRRQSIRGIVDWRDGQRQEHPASVLRIRMVSIRSPHSPPICSGLAALRLPALRISMQKITIRLLPMIERRESTMVANNACLESRQVLGSKEVLKALDLIQGYIDTDYTCTGAMLGSLPRVALGSKRNWATNGRTAETRFLTPRNR